MATRVWKPRALAVRQVQKMKISGTITEASDVTLVIAGKRIKVQSPGDTAALFCDAIATALTDLRESVPELGEATFAYVAAGDEDADPHVLLTGETAGVPFTITAEQGTPTVDVDTVVEGGPGTSGVYSFYLTGAGTGGTWLVSWDLGSGVENSTAIPYTTPLDAGAVEAAIIAGMASVGEGDITVTGTGIESDPFILTCTGDLEETTVSTPTINVSGILGNGGATVTTIRNAGARGSSTGTITLVGSDGFAVSANILITTPLGFYTVPLAITSTPSAASLQASIEAAIGSGNITVVGGDSVIDGSSLPWATYGFKFGGTLAGTACTLSVTGGNIGTTSTNAVVGGASTQDEEWLLHVNGAGASTFTLTFDGQTTGNIAIGAPATTAAAIDTALEALSNIDPSEIGVTPLASTAASSGGQWYRIQFIGGKANTNVGAMSGTLVTASAIELDKITDGAAPTLSEVQSIAITPSGAAGTTDITIATVGTTDAIALPTNAATIKARLDAITSNDVASVTGSGTSASPFVVTFTSTTNYAAMELDTTGIGGTAVTATVTVVTVGADAASEQWSIVIYGTGGTLSYSFKGARTSELAYNHNAAALDSALEGLSTIGSGQVTVTGAGTGGDPFIVTLGSNFAGESVPQLIAYNELLTGTASPTITFTTVQAATGPFHWDNAQNWENPADLSTGIPATSDDVRFELGDTNMFARYGLEQSAVALNSLTFMRGFTGGIGLPRINENGYFEYRPQYLEIGLQGSKTVNIGVGDSGGDIQMFKVDFGSTQALVTIHHTGSSVEAGMSAVCLVGTSTSSTLTIYDGDVGTAIEAGQAFNVASINARNGTLRLGKGTVIGSGGLSLGLETVWTSDGADIDGPINRY